jgi:hypothetical protein
VRSICATIKRRRRLGCGPSFVAASSAWPSVGRWSSAITSRTSSRPRRLAWSWRWTAACTRPASAGTAARRAPGTGGLPRGPGSRGAGRRQRRGSRCPDPRLAGSSGRRVRPALERWRGIPDWNVAARGASAVRVAGAANKSETAPLSKAPFQLVRLSRSRLLLESSFALLDLLS